VSARLAAVAALGAAVAVAAGAFGAHGLASRLDARALELWRTADRYLAFASVGALAVAAYRRGGDSERPSHDGWLLLGGGALFAGTLFGLALGAPRWLGAVTPVGGVAMIAGLVLFARSSLLRPAR